eukprot:m.165128 g.165128  ORF g.165128 m.165128 type:complete len:502 (+) comp31371_c0_seq1:115-1620(+)
MYGRCSTGVLESFQKPWRNNYVADIPNPGDPAEPEPDHHTHIRIKIAQYIWTNIFNRALKELDCKVNPVAQADVDFACGLPVAILSLIFSFLDVASLLTSSLVCHAWKDRILTYGNKVWLGLCLEQGWRVLSNTNWLEEFKDRSRKEHRWKRGKCKVLVPRSARGKHKTPVRASFVDLDRNQVISAGDTTLRAWSLATGASHIMYDWGTCISTMFTPEIIDKILVGAEGGKLLMLGFPEAHPMWTAGGHTDAVECGCFCGDFVVTGGSDKLIKIWNAKTGESLSTIYGHQHEVRRLVALPNIDNVVISMSFESTMKIWEIGNTSSLVVALSGHTEQVSCFKVHGSSIVSGSFDRSVIHWDTDAGGLIVARMTGHEGEVYCVDFTTSLIASGDSKSEIRLWRLDGHPVRVFSRDHIGVVRDIYIDHHKVVSGGDQRRLIVWDLNDSSRACSQVIHRQPRLVTQLFVTPDKLISTGPEGNGIVVIIDFTETLPLERSSDADSP